MKFLENRLALVTGAASGIGLGITEMFVEHGAQVIAVDIAGDRLSSLFDDNDNVHAVTMDISDREAPRLLREKAEEIFGGLDILVNNAGIAGDLVHFENCTDENWARVMATNVDPVFRVTREFIPLLKKSRFGRIISTGSVCSDFAIELLGAYGASKHAVQGIMRGFALELGRYGITSNCILPGNTVTGITKAFYPDPETPEGKAYLEATNVLGRYSQPRDLAGAVLYLASDLGSYVTGQSIGVDGGMMNRMPSLPAHLLPS